MSPVHSTHKRSTTHHSTGPHHKTTGKKDQTPTPAGNGKTGGQVKDGFDQTSVSKDPALMGDAGSTQWKTVTGGKLFVQGAGFDDPVQNPEILDCYFMSSLSALAKTKPEAIEKAIRDNGDRTYSVRFFDAKGKAQTVRVDGDLPQQGGLIYGRSRDAKELWAPLMEKAWAVYRGGYEAIGQGGRSEEALAALTGKPSQSYNSLSYKVDDLYKLLDDSLKQGKAVVAGTSGLVTSKSGLEKRHAYAVLGVEESGGAKFVKVRNPYGKGEPGSDGKDDGIFRIPIKDFRSSFEVFCTNQPA